MRDLRPLAEPSARSLTERTLDAAQDWSAQSTPRGELEATRGLELSDESRSHYFGHRAGLEVEQELQRQAVLLKGLLRDVAIMRDTVWHLSDELACVSAPANDFAQLSADVRELQRAFSCLSRQEEDAERAKLASYESRSLEETRFEEAQSFRELETRFEEHSRMLESRFEDLHPSFRHLETRFEEHKSTLDSLDARFSDLQSLRGFESRFEEHRQILEKRFAEHSRMLERFDEHPGLKHLETRLEEHKSTLDARFEDVQGLHRRMADLEVWLRGEVSRQSLYQLSSNIAQEVIEQASVSVTPLLRAKAEEMARARPATSPASSGVGRRPGSPLFLPQALHAERVVQVASEVAREVVHSVLADLDFQLRDTPSPQLSTRS